MHRTSFAVAALSLTLAAALHSQVPDQPSARQPEITSTGRGVVHLSPDYAYVTIGVRTQSASAVETASQNATRVAAVIAALRAAGLIDQQIVTSGYALEQTYEYPKNASPKLSGFIARNGIRAEVRRLDDVGKVIDAAINAGATDISSIQFLATTTDEARRATLADAMKQARMDADVIARSAGGSLGRLISVNFSTAEPIEVRGASLQGAIVATGATLTAGSVPTPVNPGELTVMAQVFARWEYVAAR